MENEQSQIKWYVIHVYSSYESVVKNNLEKMIEKCKPDDVIMITQCMKYAMYGVQSPQFIGLDKNYKRKSDFVDDLEL